MSVQATYIGNVQDLVLFTFSNTTKQDITTADNDSLTLASFAFCNSSGGAVVCQLYWFEARSSTSWLIWHGSVAAATTVIISDLPVRLRDTDKIQAVANTGVNLSLAFMFNVALGR